MNLINRAWNICNDLKLIKIMFFFSLDLFIFFYFNFSGPSWPGYYQYDANFSFLSMLPGRSSAALRFVVQCFIMTSPYFTQGSSVVTRRGNQTAGCTPAASLRSRLTNRRRNVDPASSVEVKLEVEEARICEQRPSTVPSSAGNAHCTQTLVEIFWNEWTGLHLPVF